MSEDLSLLHEEINKVKERNKRVELEKAWETSKTRAFSIIILTYFVMCCVLYIIKHEDFYIHAIVPTIGYFLSTISLPYIKRWWIKRFGSN